MASRTAGATLRRVVGLGAGGALLMLALAGVAEAQEAGMMKALAHDYNASGLALYRALARRPGNVVLSPYSIGSALAMVHSGARGETEREMAAALKMSLPREAVDAANAALLNHLKGYDRTADPGYCPKGTHRAGDRCEAAPAPGGGCPPLATREGDTCVASPSLPSATLVVANALALPKGAPGVSKAYAGVLRDSYAAAVLEGGGAADINAWVAQRTAGKIGRIVDALPHDAGPVLINAVYLKAAWHSPFALSATRDGDFSLSATARVRVPMMHQLADLALVERAGWRALRLDYAERSLSLIVVLPQEVEGIDRVAEGLDAAELTGLIAALRGARPKLVALALPRFKATSSADLAAPLQAAGMRLAFSDAADFSGMTGGGARVAGLKIAAVKHRAVIEVDERGTEAAAATSAVMAPTSALLDPPQPVPFVVDRPFLFLVVDNASGAVLFQGRLADPRRQD
jgi:serpin B